MMLEDLEMHPLVIPRAKALQPLAYREYLSAAADLLGLSPHADRIAASSALEKAQRAIVLQANALVGRGTEADVYSKESVDGLSRDYRDEVILPYAQLLANDVLAAIGALHVGEGDYAVIRTRR